MTNEPQELKTTDSTAPATDQTPADSGSPDNSVVEQDDLKKEGVDYSAELSRLTAERENYKRGMLKAKKQVKELKEDEGEARAELNDDLVETLETRISGKLAEQLDLQQQKWQQVKEQEMIGDVLKSVSVSEAERDLIKFHYDNSIKHTGYSRKNIQEDVQNAKLLANRQQLLEENEELKAALTSQSTKGTSPQFGGQKTLDVSEERKVESLGPEDKAILEKYGAMDRFKKT